MASPEVDSGKATKADMAHMKREARERESAYQQGVEDAESPGNGGGRESGSSSRPGLPKLSFSTDAQKLIVVAMTITVIVALIENAHQPKGQKGVPTANIIVGGFVSGSLLLGMSYFLPEFASGFALVAMLATILERGKPFWDIIGNVTGTPLPATSKEEPKSKAKPAVQGQPPPNTNPYVLV